MVVLKDYYVCVIYLRVCRPKIDKWIEYVRVSGATILNDVSLILKTH